MGKRSRKRMAVGEQEADGARTAATRAERDEARRRRVAAEKASGGQPIRSARGGKGERPPAPWGKFPLVELVVLVGIVLIVIGVITWGRQGQTMLIAGFALASLAGLELSVREHFAGFKSHTTLLAGAVGVIVMTITFVLSGGGAAGYYAAVAVGAVVFGLCFWRLRETFKRRSGGLGFR